MQLHPCWMKTEFSKWLYFCFHFFFFLSVFELMISNSGILCSFPHTQEPQLLHKCPWVNFPQLPACRAAVFGWNIAKGGQGGPVTGKVTQGRGCKWLESGKMADSGHRSQEEWKHRGFKCKHMWNDAHWYTTDVCTSVCVRASWMSLNT